MKNLRVFTVFLLFLLFAIGGCAFGGSSSEAPAVSSDTTSSETSLPFESSASNIYDQTPSAESQASQPAIPSTEVSRQESSQEQPSSSDYSPSDRVTYELRAKYFELLSRNYSEIVPYMDFDSPDDFSLNDLVMYATLVTEPSKKGDPEIGSTSVFPRTLLQKSVKKYLGIELGALSASSPVYIYHAADDVVYMNARLPSKVCYYRLNSITENDGGVVTAEFSVYREDFPGINEYEQQLEAIKSDICGSALPNADEYDFFKVVTLSFTEHTDAGGTYLTFLSEVSLDR